MQQKLKKFRKSLRSLSLKAINVHDYALYDLKLINHPWKRVVPTRGGWRIIWERGSSWRNLGGGVPCNWYLFLWRNVWLRFRLRRNLVNLSPLLLLRIVLWWGKVWSRVLLRRGIIGLALRGSVWLTLWREVWICVGTVGTVRTSGISSAWRSIPRPRWGRALTLGWWGTPLSLILCSMGWGWSVPVGRRWLPPPVRWTIRLSVGIRGTPSVLWWRWGSVSITRRWHISIGRRWSVSIRGWRAIIFARWGSPLVWCPAFSGRTFHLTHSWRVVGSPRGTVSPTHRYSRMSHATTEWSGG